MEQNLSKKLREKGQVARYTFDDIKTVSTKMERTKKLGMKIAESDYTILITGESGTGKELMAQSIHNASPRHSQPFIAINCALCQKIYLKVNFLDMKKVLLQEL